MSGLFFLNPKIVREASTILEARNIRLEQPKPKPEPTPKAQKAVTHETRDIVVPPIDPVIKIEDQRPIEFTKTPPVDFGPPGGEVRTIVEPARPAPLVIGPSIDPRYASSFQPAYPADEIRGGNAGRVTVRVLIGTDGRVKDIERVSAASDSFWEATRRQALTKWRFKPATPRRRRL